MQTVFWQGAISVYANKSTPKGLWPIIRIVISAVDQRHNTEKETKTNPFLHHPPKPDSHSHRPPRRSPNTLSVNQGKHNADLPKPTDRTYRSHPDLLPPFTILRSESGIRNTRSQNTKA